MDGETPDKTMPASLNIYINWILLTRIWSRVSANYEHLCELHIINIGKWMAKHQTNRAREPVKAFYDAYKLAQFVRIVEEEVFLNTKP